MKNGLSISYKVKYIPLLSQQFYSEVFTREKWKKYVHKGHEQKCSEHFHSKVKNWNDRQQKTTYSSIFIMEYYLALKRSNLFINATTWMNLKTLCWAKEVRHKIIYVVCPSVLSSKTSKNSLVKKSVVNIACQWGLGGGRINWEGA